MFRTPRFACISCHQVKGEGGTVGPELTWRARCLTPEEIVESVLWPKRRIKAGVAANHFAQAWNYRYSSAYGSPEFSSRHPDTPGHDRLAVASAHVLADGHQLFLEIPDLQPVNQVHFRLSVDTGTGSRRVRHHT